MASLPPPAALKELDVEVCCKGLHPGLLLVKTVEAVGVLDVAAAQRENGSVGRTAMHLLPVHRVRFPGCVLLLYAPTQGPSPSPSLNDQSVKENLHQRSRPHEKLFFPLKAVVGEIEFGIIVIVVVLVDVPLVVLVPVVGLAGLGVACPPVALLAQLPREAVGMDLLAEMEHAVERIPSCGRHMWREGANMGPRHHVGVVESSSGVPGQQNRGI
mmetsp:Transcript_25749/g.72052  ORF Transcript_25749/g.72052 Transcript_25749/m.72052 type:complete len:214 (-) Transcript_25749:928-1569(-)